MRSQLFVLCLALATLTGCKSTRAHQTATPAYPPAAAATSATPTSTIAAR